MGGMTDIWRKLGGVTDIWRKLGCVRDNRRKLGDVTHIQRKLGGVRDVTQRRRNLWNFKVPLSWNTKICLWDLWYQINKFIYEIHFFLFNRVSKIIRTCSIERKPYLEVTQQYEIWARVPQLVILEARIDRRSFIIPLSLRELNDLK